MLREDELREKVLQLAKRHKASWIELGQYLYAIHKDKLFKTWGYLAFETYCRKELSLKETTAAKMLKSYYFLEQVKPAKVSREMVEADHPKAIPDYESVNLLRIASEGKKLSASDLEDLSQSVLELGQEPKTVRAQVKKMTAAIDSPDPREEKQNRRNALLKKMLTVLSQSKTQLESDRLLPDYLLKQIAELCRKLEDQLEELAVRG